MESALNSNLDLVSLVPNRCNCNFYDMISNILTFLFEGFFLKKNLFFICQCRLNCSFSVKCFIFVLRIHFILTLFFLGCKFALVPYTYYPVLVAACCLHSSYGTTTSLLVHLELYLACLDPCSQSYS